MTSRFLMFWMRFYECLELQHRFLFSRPQRPYNLYLIMVVDSLLAHFAQLDTRVAFPNWSNLPNPIVQNMLLHNRRFIWRTRLATGSVIGYLLEAMGNGTVESLRNLEDEIRPFQFEFWCSTNIEGNIPEVGARLQNRGKLVFLTT